MSTNYIKLNKSFLDFNKYNNFTYIEVLLSLNIRIPHICYHNQLPVSGNCRLCLGIIGADKKPAPLCATSVRPNDIVDYNSARVRRLRQDVLEFLLINHPMDCPSCDQGGECDLQDYSYNFGSDRSRHTYTFKKAILNKDRGAIVKTVMNRCLNCTRCTRFFAEVVGSTLIGIIGRGRNSEIGSYVDTKFTDCEFSGNVIDLCPVGALTSHANAFAYRPWNLTRYNSFDALDSLGSSITLHYYGAQIVKVTPRINYTLNLNWISDKVRYIFDGLYKQRLLKPLYNENGIGLTPVSWNEIFYYLKKDLLINLKNINLGMYFGELLNNETIFYASKFMDILGNSNKYSVQDTLYINNDFDSNYLFNSKVKSLSDTDFCAIFGSNLKSELPLLNVRLRKQYLSNALPILNFGAKTALTYPAYYFGFKLKTIVKFIEGNSNFCKLLFNKKNPLFLLNIDLFKNETLFNFFGSLKNILISNIKNISKDNFNYIYPNIDLYNKLYLNIQTKYKDTLNSINCLYLLNVDNNFDKLVNNINLNFAKLYTIYQGHHYNKYINFANVVLPSKTYLQEIGSFINLEGDICKIKDIVFDDNIYVKENIIILYSVFNVLFDKIKNNLKQIVDMKYINTLNPVFNFKESYTIKDNLTLFNNIKIKNTIIKNYTINSTLYNFYTNDNISMSSQIMANCNKSLVKRSNY